ncbi:MAG TPA: glycogen debranching enzyme N-terminal domain-containing protein, partial [Candidatus Acidoferrum sp.]|nr:glycogen debranching enzyme N-terminal domain-containing protein [Candidatus Acidoferrum sp.]
MSGATMIQFKKDVCGDLGSALSREWLETNGIGGFASSTIIGLNSRRYHGLLVAATKPPVGRYVLLSKLEETLFIEGHAIDLSANRYPGVVHPHGFRYLKQFRLDPFPVFTFEIEGIEIEKSVFMIQGENSVVVQYELTRNNHPECPKSLRLEVRPLIAFRDYHSTTHENGVINGVIEQQRDRVSVTPYQGLPSLHFAHNAAEVAKTGVWYRNFEYDAERERGLDFQEDLFNPLLLKFDLRSRKQAAIIASTEPRDVSQAAVYRQKEVARRTTVAKSSPVNDAFAQALTSAADQYLVSRGENKTVIAG